jgi:hypothetical protein
MGKQYWVLSDLFQVLKNKLFSFVNIMDENINFMCSIQVLDSFLKGLSHVRKSARHRAGDSFVFSFCFDWFVGVAT